MSGRNSGGDIFDMAEDGTSVPNENPEQRNIKSVPRPGEAADARDPNQMGSTTFAGAATNAEDIPRSTRDTADTEIITGTGDALPSQVDSKRLHDVPGGVTHDDAAKGSTRCTKHKAGESDFVTAADDGGAVEKAPGDESLIDEQAADKYDGKE